MKMITQPCATFLLCLLARFTAEVFCVERVHCQWGSYGSWSNCDPCTKLQTRSRVMAVYAQFDGSVCSPGRAETRPCETTQACPLEEGCGGRFRCRSGKCISKSLLCNGDQDCEEDGLDEQGCGAQKFLTCDSSIPPPNVELLGLGVDVVSGERRGSVINTRSFGGQCRTIFSGVHSRNYRLPLSTIQYNFLVTVQNDFSDEMFSSKWHYAKDIVQKERVTGTTTGFGNYHFLETHDQSQSHQLVVLKNDIEVIQFRANAPRYLPLSEEFWKALMKLPSVYDYSAYRRILELFGTHYVSEGGLGGSVNAVVGVDEQTEKHMTRMTYESRECEKKKRWVLFIPFVIERCRSNSDQRSTSRENVKTSNIQRVDVVGGGPAHIEPLKKMQFSNSEKIWELYSNWADSIRSFPQIIKQKLRPLSELVKEVQCAGLKRLYLRRAIAQYQAESDACHCRPCRNNGLAVMNADECKCICKPGTSGLACEVGTEAEGQQGVIHGSWSCWSSWSVCTRGQRSRDRSCSNPSPQGGGQHCVGQSTESSGCEDEEELQYLKTMEPQCFDKSLPPLQKCGTPPPLVNGYILDPKDSYFAGSRIEYTCTMGFRLVGSNAIECKDDQTWSGRPGPCAASVCRLPVLSEGVVASPVQDGYHLGDAVTLSCPEGRVLEGEDTVTCDSSLNFSPDPAQTTCSLVTLQQPTAPSVKCKEWEKLFKGKCVCKMPHECGSSLELCATAPGRQQFVPMTVCKMHAIQCMGRNFEIAEHNSCKWPERLSTTCSRCHMWENCDKQSNECHCKDAADCVAPGSDVCVRMGEDAPLTMSECEAGQQRCRGANLTLISISPCTL